MTDSLTGANVVTLVLDEPLHMFVKGKLSVKFVLCLHRIEVGPFLYPLTPSVVNSDDLFIMNEKP